MADKIRLNPGDEAKIEELLDRVLGAAVDQNFEGVDKIISTEMKKLFDFEGTGPKCMDPDCLDGKLNLNDGLRVPMERMNYNAQTAFPCKECGLMHTLQGDEVHKTPKILWRGKEGEMEWCYMMVTKKELVKKSELPENSG